MNAAELVGMAFLKGEKHIKIWDEFKRHASDDTLRIIAEYEFESVISEVTEMRINRAVQKIEAETT